MSAGARRQVVTFALGERVFAAGVEEVERVLRYSEPTPLPGLPEWVAGVVEHSGRPLAVVDLRRRFELPPAPGGVERRILVVDAGGFRMGAVVDRVLDVLSLAADQVEPAPPVFHGLAGGYVDGVLQRSGNPIVVIRAARLLSAAERVMLDAVPANA